MQCQAKSKRSQGPCKNFAVQGRRNCRMHGGKSLAGYQLPQTRTAKYSTIIPSLILDSRVLRDQ